MWNWLHKAVGPIAQWQIIYIKFVWYIPRWRPLVNVSGWIQKCAHVSFSSPGDVDHKHSCKKKKKISTEEKKKGKKANFAQKRQLEQMLGEGFL